MSYEFNVEKVAEAAILRIREWFEKNGPGCSAVLGVSGGKDSTIAAALCVKALGKERVIGVLLPEGEQADIADSHEVCDFLGIKRHVINIKEGVEATYRQLEKAGIKIAEQTRVNTPPRERTKNIRAVCQSENGRMMNTCNLSEDFIGYFTVGGGDGDGDFSPLGDLTATEVVAIGKYLELPLHLVEKTPSDGLCGKTDEDNFGFTYKVLDRYIRTGEIDDMEAKAKIDKLHQNNLFKMKPMAMFFTDLPIKAGSSWFKTRSLD